MKIVVSSADELRGNKEFQTALLTSWPAIRAYLDDRLREVAYKGDPSYRGIYMEAHFDIIRHVEALMSEPINLPQMRSRPKLHNRDQ